MLLIIIIASFHDPDPDGMGGGDELDLAIYKLSVDGIRHFPVADVCIGNHDRIISRKACLASGVPKRWVKVIWRSIRNS